MADHFPELSEIDFKYENKLGDRMLCCCRSDICLLSNICLWQLINLLATDKSQNFAQPFLIH